MNSHTPPLPYLARMRADLMTLKEQLNALLDLSTINYVNPNTPDSGVVFVTAADWGRCRYRVARAGQQARDGDGGLEAVSVGVLARAFPRELVDEVIDATGAREQRSGRCRRG